LTKSKNPLELHLAGEKKESIRYLSLKQPDALKKIVLKSFAVVSVWFPEFTEQATKEIVLNEFTRAISQRYPDYLGDELEFVFRRDLPTLKTYGRLKLSDLFQLLDNYMEERAVIREENHQNQKAFYKKEESEDLPGIDYDSVKEKFAADAQKRKQKREQQKRDIDRTKNYDANLNPE